MRFFRKKDKTAAEPKVINTKCPIMGGKVDPYSVPDNLTREFEGKRIGFCCAACPGEWDKLSQEQKEQKLSQVLEQQQEQQTAEVQHQH